MASGDRILVVDDDRVHCMQLESVLSSLGFRVQTATSAVTALELAAATHPDLVVCDADMPETDGWSLVRHMRASDTMAVVPVFLMLDADDKSSRVRAFQVGADACFIKPLDYEELAAQIRRKLTHHTQVLERSVGPRPRRPARRTTSLVLSGQIQKMGLGSVLSVLALEERSGTLRVLGSGNRQGRIVMFQGQVAGAEVTGAGPARGAEAVFDIVTWREGRFIFRDERETVHGGEGRLLRVQELLLEAARRADETTR